MLKDDRIFIASFKIFDKYGYKRTNVQDIADEAGVSKKTIYNHFTNKDDLFNKTIEWYAKFVVETYTAFIDDENISSIDKLKRFMLDSSNFMKNRNSNIHRDMILENPHLKAVPNVYIQKNLARMLGRLIDAMKEEGTFRTDYKTEAVVYLMFSAVNGLSSWNSPDILPVSIPELYTTAARIFFTNLLTEKGLKSLDLNSLQDGFFKGNGILFE